MERVSRLTRQRKLIHKIKEKLGHRSQRWLATQINMKEVALSNKLRGQRSFADFELELISKTLNIELL